MPKDEIGFLIKQISDKMRAGADAELKEHQLTYSQVRILAYLHRNKEQATQKEIEEYLEVAHPTVVGLVSRLAANGFVECHVDPGDRRNKVVRLTSKAHCIKAMIDKKRAQSEKKLSAHLSQAQKEELTRLLQVVCRNIE